LTQKSQGGEGLRRGDRGNVKKKTISQEEKKWKRGKGDTVIRLAPKQFALGEGRGT